MPLCSATVPCVITGWLLSPLDCAPLVASREWPVIAIGRPGRAAATTPSIRRWNLPLARKSLTEPACLRTWICSPSWIATPTASRPRVSEWWSREIASSRASWRSAARSLEQMTPKMPHIALAAPYTASGRGGMTLATRRAAPRHHPGVQRTGGARWVAPRDPGAARCDRRGARDGGRRRRLGRPDHRGRAGARRAPAAAVQEPRDRRRGAGRAAAGAPRGLRLRRAGRRRRPAPAERAPPPGRRGARPRGARSRRRDALPRWRERVPL